MKKSAKPPLRIVSDLDATGPQPSRPLGAHGQALWRRVLGEYDVSDAAGVEMLTQACQACDRAEALAGHLREDGEIVRTPQGIKAHPAIREELSCRGFVVRTLQKLGLNFEPLRASPGRPPGRGP
jgi:phage terminase small subunit